MVSIDALFEVLEAAYGPCSIKIDKHINGRYVAIANTAEGAKCGGADTTASGALHSLAARLAAETEATAGARADDANRATADAATAARLAIQAKRVVDGFAQGASE